MAPSIVQWLAFTAGGATPTTDFELDDPPTPGNFLVIWHAARDTREPIAPPGFTSHPDGHVAAQFSSGQDQDRGRWYVREVMSGDDELIESVVTDLEGYAQNVYIAELAGVDVIEFGPSLSYQVSSPLESPSVELVDDDAMILAGFVWFETGTVSPLAGATELHDDPLDGPFHPTSWVAELVEDTGDHIIAGTPSAGTSSGYGVQTLIAYGPGVPDEPPVDPGYVPPGPARAILELYVHDEDASRWGTATWADHDDPPAVGTEGAWSGAGWQDITPQGVMVHIIWGSRRADRGILADQDAAVWNVQTYDPDRELDPGNADSPWWPQLLPTTPIRISHNGNVIRTGTIEELTYSHKRPEYQGQIIAAGPIALGGRSEVPDDTDLGDTLLERVQSSIEAAGVAIGGIAFEPASLPGGGTGPALSARIEGFRSVWAHISGAAREVLWVAYEDRHGTLQLRPWGDPLDRGAEIADPLLEDLLSSVSEDGTYSAVRVANVDDTVTITRVVDPLPRYGRRVYERTEKTIDPEAWADAILADRAWPGVKYRPGTLVPRTADQVDMLGLLEVMERVQLISVSGGVSVSGRVLGGELWAEHKRGHDGATWRFRFEVATDGSSAVGIDTLVSDGTGDTLIDDATGGDYLEVD